MTWRVSGSRPPRSIPRGHTPAKLFADGAFAIDGSKSKAVIKRNEVFTSRRVLVQNVAAGATHQPPLKAALAALEQCFSRGSTSPVEGPFSPSIAIDKGERQIEMTSHNAKLLALSDPSNVSVLEGFGDHGQVMEQGFLATRRLPITQFVLEILSGRERALELRYAKYSTFAGLGLTLQEKKLLVVTSTTPLPPAMFASLAKPVLDVDAPGAITQDFAHVTFKVRSLTHWPRVDAPRATQP